MCLNRIEWPLSGAPAPRGLSRMAPFAGVFSHCAPVGNSGLTLGFCRCTSPNSSWFRNSSLVGPAGALCAQPALAPGLSCSTEAPTGNYPMVCPLDPKVFQLRITLVEGIQKAEPCWRLLSGCRGCGRLLHLHRKWASWSVRSKVWCAGANQPPARRGRRRHSLVRHIRRFRDQWARNKPSDCNDWHRSCEPE